MSNIKFSVVIPTKNRLDLLKYAIKSVQNQDYQNWELIISDNCSEEDIGGYVSSLNDSRITCVRQNEPLSVCDNWNKVNDLATGDYIIMLGDDDALLPEYFSRCLEQIEKFDNPELIYHSCYYYMQSNVSPIEPDGWVKSSKYIHPLTACSQVPYLMPREHIETNIKSTMNLFFTFGFNAQFFLYSKELVKKMEKYGKFYQPPYPDTYAANMMMLVADSVVVIPYEMVILGITPKSYGWYHANNKEKEGMSFHKDADYREYAPLSVRNKLLNIAEMQTAAVATLALIPEKFPERDDLHINIDAYYNQVVQRIINDYDKKTADKILAKEVFPKLNLKQKFENWKLAKKYFKEKVNPEIVHDKTYSYENSQVLIEAYKNKTLKVKKF